MPTLKREFERLASYISDYHAAENFLREYGGYEIVEGVLEQVSGVYYSDQQNWRYTLVFKDRPSIDLGWRGDHIKLLVPPEVVAERDQPGDREKRLEAALEIIHARLNWHKEAMMAATGKPSHTSWEEILLTIDTARRALEEEDE